LLHLATATSDAVCDLVWEFRSALVPQIRALALDVGIYDGLLPSLPVTVKVTSGSGEVVLNGIAGGRTA
jgi:hypothetical protein